MAGKEKHGAYEIVINTRNGWALCVPVTARVERHPSAKNVKEKWLCVPGTFEWKLLQIHFHPSEFINRLIYFCANSGRKGSNAIIFCTYVQLFLELNTPRNRMVQIVESTSNGKIKNAFHSFLPIFGCWCNFSFLYVSKQSEIAVWDSPTIFSFSKNFDNCQQQACTIQTKLFWNISQWERVNRRRGGAKNDLSSRPQGLIWVWASLTKIPGSTCAMPPCIAIQNYSPATKTNRKFKKEFILAFLVCKLFLRDTTCRLVLLFSFLIDRTPLTRW